MHKRINLTAIVLASGLAIAGCTVADGEDGIHGETAVTEDTDEDIGISEEALESWLPPISEETGPAYCPYHTLVTGADCTGAYCDNVSLLCRDVPGVQYNYSWTTYFSEEGAYYRICSNGFMSGLQCTGGWCDNMRLECVSVSGAVKWPCYWSGWFSEENPATILPVGYAVAGMGCSGPWCDNINLYYCKL